jgi:hypothetical protein
MSTVQWDYRDRPTYQAQEMERRRRQMAKGQLVFVKIKVTEFQHSFAFERMMKGGPPRDPALQEKAAA